jgi:hypothetical protein
MTVRRLPALFLVASLVAVSLFAGTAFAALSPDEETSSPVSPICRLPGDDPEYSLECLERCADNTIRLRICRV